MKNKTSKNKGQVMLLSALLIGGSILSATSIAGYLMLLQIRQSANIANSAKAITAASSGVDWALYQNKTKTPFGETTIDFSNGSQARVKKIGSVITSTGKFGDSYRAFSVDVSATSVLPPGN
jgi:uncharacterized protein (UPF0333 family)